MFLLIIVIAIVALILHVAAWKVAIGVVVLGAIYGVIYRIRHPEEYKKPVSQKTKISKDK